MEEKICWLLAETRKKFLCKSMIRRTIILRITNDENDGINVKSLARYDGRM